MPSTFRPGVSQDAYNPAPHLLIFPSSGIRSGLIPRGRSLCFQHMYPSRSRDCYCILAVAIQPKTCPFVRLIPNVDEALGFDSWIWGLGLVRYARLTSLARPRQKGTPVPLRVCFACFPAPGVDILSTRGETSAEALPRRLASVTEQEHPGPAAGLLDGVIEGELGARTSHHVPDDQGTRTPSGWIMKVVRSFNAYILRGGEKEVSCRTGEKPMQLCTPYTRTAPT
jgi:hypothetical protein